MSIVTFIPLYLSKLLLENVRLTLAIGSDGSAHGPPARPASGMVSLPRCRRDGKRDEQKVTGEEEE